MKLATLVSLAVAAWIGATIPDASAQSSGIKDMLGGLWGRLRAATPRSSATGTATTVTAGLRGSEATEAELKALEGAQALADSGKFAEAAKAFDAFVTQNPHSPLAANAVFGSACAYAALGDRNKAVAGFQ